MWLFLSGVVVGVMFIVILAWAFFWVLGGGKGIL